MRPNETKVLELIDNRNFQTWNEFIESADACSVNFAIQVKYELGDSHEVPLYIQVTAPDVGLPGTFAYRFELYSLQTGRVLFREITSYGSRASRKVSVRVNPLETWMLRVSKPKTSWFSKLMRKPKLNLYVGPMRNSRTVDIVY